MRRNNLICLTLLVSIFLFGYAEGSEENKSTSNILFGIKAGVNFSTTTDADFGDFVVESKNYNGYSFGLFADYTLNSKVSLRSELLYSKKGFTLPEMPIIDVSGSQLETFTPKQYFTYIEIPFTGNYNILQSENINMSLSAGPSVSFLLDSKDNMGFGSGIIDENNYRDVTDLYKSLDWGFVFGASAGFAIGGKEVFLEGRYALGLTDIFKNESGVIEKKHRVISISAGLYF